MKKILTIIFSVMFFSGVILGMTGRILSINNNQDYDVIQEEIFTAEEICDVIYDDNILYVCYNDSSCVNVYTSEREFLWAVSTPYLRNSYFDITEEGLIIYNNDTAYIYNEKNGEFIRKTDSSSLELSFDLKRNKMTSSVEPLNYYYDLYTVYRSGEDNLLTPIIMRPIWIRIFNYTSSFVISAIGAVGIGGLLLINRVKERKKYNSDIQNKTILKLKRYIKITVSVQIIYSILNIINAFLSGVFIIFIFPIAIHFIISNIIIQNIKPNEKVSEKDKAIFLMWNSLNWASFIMSFISVIISALILEGNL